jgi:hypothetical protein
MALQKGPVVATKLPDVPLSNKIMAQFLPLAYFHGSLQPNEDAKTFPAFGNGFCRSLVELGRGLVQFRQR